MFTLYAHASPQSCDILFTGIRHFFVKCKQTHILDKGFKPMTTIEVA